MFPLEKIDDGDGVADEAFESFFHDFGLVVGALDQLSAALITSAGLFWGVGVNVVKGAAGGADAPAAEAFDYGLRIEGQNDDGTEVEFMVLQQLKK